MIAITGAAGFIGSNLACVLAREEPAAELVLVDHPLDRSRAANLALPDGASFRFVSHGAFLEALAGGQLAPSLIYHLGACSDTTETRWPYLLENNVAYSQRLWQWSAGHGTRLVYASSAATYGNGSQGFSDRLHPSRLVPLNLYGKSKNDFDAWALEQVAGGHPAPPVWAGMKFFNVYGPRELHKGRMASVVYHGLRQLREEGCVRLFRSNDPGYADGGQMRDFVYVEDCIAHMRYFAGGGGPSGLYNSGSGQARSFADLAHAICAAAGRPAEIRFVDMPEALRSTYQNFTQADLQSLRAAGCTTAPTSLEEGVARTVAWILEQTGG